MLDSRIYNGILFSIGFFTTMIGFWRLIDPVAAHENIGIVLGDDVELLNQARGTAGIMIGLGFLILLGAFKKELSYTSNIVAIVFFFSVAIARIIAIIIDGNPGDALIQGSLLPEIVFGTLALFALMKSRDNSLVNNI